MSGLAKFIVGLLGVALLTISAFYTKREPIRDDLTARAQDVLLKAGHDWARVSLGDPDETRYRIATISGAPVDGDAADEAVAAVGAIAGIHKAVFQGDKTAMPTPFNWRADHEAGQVVLSGDVPDEATRAALYKHAVSLFEPTKVVDRMTVKTGAPAGDWVDIATLGLDQLKTLEPGGYALLSDQELTVWGTAPNADVKVAVEQAVSATLPGGYLGRPTVTLASASASAPAAPADPCGDKVTQSVAGRTIGFASGRAELTEAGRAVLDDVAKVLTSCPNTLVQVEGHTDSRGDDGANLALSQARAEAVTAYLASRSIAAGRMSAKGLGETAPLAAEETPEAWARNRRIEFKVTRAQ